MAEGVDDHATARTLHMEWEHRADPSLVDDSTGVLSCKGFCCEGSKRDFHLTCCCCARKQLKQKQPAAFGNSIGAMSAS